MGYRPRPGKVVVRDKPPRPPGWGWLRGHSSHQMIEVESGGTVVAHLCDCGEQLPPQIHRDPDGQIVGASWEPR